MRRRLSRRRAHADAGPSQQLQRRVSVVVSVISLAAVAWWVSNQDAPKFPDSLGGYLWLVGRARGLRARAGRPRLALAPHHAPRRDPAPARRRLPAHARRLHGQQRAARARRRGAADRDPRLAHDRQAAHDPRLDHRRAHARRRRARRAVRGAHLVRRRRTPRPASGPPRSPPAGSCSAASRSPATSRCAGAGSSSASTRRCARSRARSRCSRTPRACCWPRCRRSIWSCEGVTLLLVGNALGLELHFLDSILIIVLASLLAAIPAAPGYAGTFDAGPRARPQRGRRRRAARPSASSCSRAS